MTKIITEIRCGTELYSDTCQMCGLMCEDGLCTAFSLSCDWDDLRRTYVRLPACMESESKLAALRAALAVKVKHGGEK